MAEATEGWQPSGGHWEELVVAMEPSSLECPVEAVLALVQCSGTIHSSREASLSALLLGTLTIDW